MTDTDCKDFKELIDEPNILQNLHDQGFLKATLVQTLAIPPALKNKDLVVEAKTGSGKTLSFGIPMLVQLKKASASQPPKDPFGLVVTPTRELAVQIASVFSSVMPELEVATLIGGIPYRQQKKALEKDPRIVVGTPGRILDSIDRKDLNFSKLKLFVLDEADEMFSIGFREEVEDILSEIPKKAQGLFVSATISPMVESLAKKYLHESESISATNLNESPPDIEHLFCQAERGVSVKPNLLCNLLITMNPDSAIVFCNTKSETEIVEKFMRRQGFDARRINSDLNQKQRNYIMDRIRAKKLRYLIATDIAARGIDIEEIEIVVNFSIHQQPESYIHRTGRTGRAGKKGIALSLVGPEDFMSFKAVKGLDLPLKEIPQPTPEEILSSRLVHLKNNLKPTAELVTEDDLVLASKILEQGSNEEVQTLVASLARYTQEHLLHVDVKSLDEELAKEEEKSPSGNKRKNNRRSRKR